MNSNTSTTGGELTVMCRQKLCLSVFLIYTLTLCMPALATEINTEQVEKDHELENIRSQIKTVESSIEDAKKEIVQLTQELRKNEIAATEASTKLQSYQQQITEKNKHLIKLAEDKQSKENLLASQRLQLSAQIRAAYRTGRSNYLKLLLNQENPEQVGRMLAYYDYDNRARSKHITEINLALEDIARLEQTIQSQTRELAKLQDKQKKQLEQFQSYRKSRQTITARLQTHIDEQGMHLQLLQKDAQELEKLVGELKHQDLAIQVYEDMPPFSSLRGKLEWPVKGRISSRFGSLRKGGKLKWQGITIDANSGVEVKAISTGKVIFADWFRNMGLLLILDHGDGYMSLYGHNERLLKKPGDWVLAGELIARVGDTGGQQQAGLYFEIRQSGNPVNPQLWCKN